MNKNSSWVLMRGLAREHRHWEVFPDQLKNKFPHSEIILPDLPGSGIHNQTSCPMRIDQIVESVRRDIDIQSRAEPVYLIGLSMGGMIAVEWSNAYPEEICGAVLINTSLRGISPFYQRLRPANYLKILTGIFMQNDLQQKETTILELTSNLHPQQQRIIEHWVTYARQNPVSRITALNQLIAASRYRAPESKPQVPILIVSGLGDRLINPDCSVAIAKTWQVPLQVHPVAGHDLTLDAGDWVCDEIRSWTGNMSATECNADAALYPIDQY